MQVIDDPQIFETSDIVEKSSKSGIFSNKRLLVIKNGFLYYFSNVPKGYKKHLPNILDTLQQLPKSSIQIKAIHTIKLQSAKSADLIIKFYQKDMIDRQDIRKSISTGGFQKNQKASSDLQEWKFTFTTVLQCRLWYTALIKLKQHFNKQQDKIQQFFSNFDPTRRISKVITNTSMISNQQQKIKDSNSNINNSNVNNYYNNPQPIKLPSAVSYEKTQKIETKQYQPQLQIKIQEKQQNQNSQSSQSQQSQKKQTFRKVSHDLKTITEEEQEFKLRKLEEQIRKQIADQIRHEQRNRAQKHIEIYKTKIQQKQSQLINLNKRLEEQQKIRKQEKQEYIKSLKSSPQKNSSLQNKKLSVKQFSIQTQEQQRIQPLIQPKKQNIRQLHHSVQLSYRNIQLQPEQQERLRHSAVTQMQNPKRQTIQTINIFRNTFSYIPSKTTRLSQKQEQSIDFYDDLGFIYQKQQKFEDQIQKQIKMIKYINLLKRQAIEIFQKYIDENNPQKSIKVERGRFNLEIVCSPGKIVNINGVDKLVYSNKEHQYLKRKFKLYNYLQDKLINLLKKKSSFGLRVPLSFHGQYKGYSVLVQMLPNCVQNSQQLHIPNYIQKQLTSLVEFNNTSKFLIKQIRNRSKQLYLIQSNEVYKVSDMQKSIPVGNLYYDIPSLIKQCRKNNISTCIRKIEAHNQNILDQKEKSTDQKQLIQIYQYIKLCRELKNLFRSTQPYSIADSQFFKAFLQSPQQIVSLLSQSVHLYWKNISKRLKGQLISYLSFFFGIYIYCNQNDRNVFNSVQNKTIEHFPIMRQFNLNKMSVVQISSNFQKYLKQGKQQLIQTSFFYLKEIEEDLITIQLSQIQWMMKKNEHEGSIQKLLILKQKIPYFDLRRIKCSALLIQCYQQCFEYSHMLKELSLALEYTQFMFGNNNSQKAYLYLLTAQILIKQDQIQDGIKVYKQILSKYQSIITKEDIYLSLSKNLLEAQNADPNQLIQFMQEIMKDKNRQNYFVQDKQSKIKSPVKTSKEAKFFMHLGKLYKQSKNYEKASIYFEKVMKFYEQKCESEKINLPSSNIMKEQQQQIYINLNQVGLQLISCYKNIQNKKKIYQYLIEKSNAKIKSLKKESSNALLSQQVIRSAKILYTLYFCQLIEVMLSEVEKQTLRQSINKITQQKKQQIQNSIALNQFIILKEENFKQIIKEATSKKEISKQFKEATIKSLNINEVEQFLLTQ